jgi:hypothetical protein
MLNIFFIDLFKATNIIKRRARNKTKNVNIFSKTRKMNKSISEELI